MPITPSRSSTLTYTTAITFNSGVTFNGVVLEHRVPFVPEPSHTSSMGDRAVATLLGVETTVITAFRESQPFWKLERDAQVVASGLGIDIGRLRAAIDRAKLRVVHGRMFPSGTRTGYAAIRSSRR